MNAHSVICLAKTSNPLIKYQSPTDFFSPDVPAEQQHADIAVVGVVLGGGGASESNAVALSHPHDLVLLAHDDR